jgi:DNA repair exonuclease SbcCD ATPase subunit
LVKLCTKPEASVPLPAKQMLSDLDNLEIRLIAFKTLVPVSTFFKKGHSSVGQAYEAVESRIDSLLGKKAAAKERLGKIIQARNDATAKVYSGTVGLHEYSEDERGQMGLNRKVIELTVNATFVEDWGKLAVKDALERLKLETQLLELGSQLIAGRDDKSVCPLCEQMIDDSVKEHMAERHARLKTKVGESQGKETPQSRIRTALASLTAAVDAFQTLLGRRSTQLLRATAADNAKTISVLFGKEKESAWTVVNAAANKIEPLLTNVTNTKDKVAAAVEQCEEAITSGKIELPQADLLGTSIKDYLDAASAFSSELDGLAPMLVEPARILQQSVDKLAGTGEMTLLISLMEKRSIIERALRIRDLLDSLKELKKHADQAVGEIMKAAIDSELTESVLNWYAKIRTKGDPNVHFSGFEMERTKAGDFKSRRVKVKAESYGVQLASAVSSLSESKLNALGLCVSIASALRSPGPWEFLVLDDPIQSWDDEHEDQFIQVVRALVEERGKQIILLSHKTKWVENVCSGCRTFNGLHYGITGYTQNGPHIHLLKWTGVEQRLKEIETITNDPNASGVRLQQAEEEVRLAACQMAADIAKTKLSRDTSPHNMNRKDVRAILNEAGYPAKLVDRIYASFESTDDAHHTPKDYQPNVQRIRQHLSALQELRKCS